MLLKLYRQLAATAYKKYNPIRKTKAAKTMGNKRSKGFNLDYPPNSLPIDALFSGFQKAGIKETDTIFIRTSMSAAMAFEGGIPAFISALKDYFKDGNLIMSSYTFNKSPLMFLAENPLFDPLKSVDQLSLVNEFFRRSSGVLRSIHPTHSVCAYGRNARRITCDHHKSTFNYSSKSPFAKLYELNAKEISIGVYPTSISFHYIEQFTPKHAPGYQDLDTPIMCRLLIDGYIKHYPFKVTSPFANFIQNRSVFEGTDAQPRFFTFGNNLDFCINDLQKQLAAMQNLIRMHKYWHYVPSKTQNLTLAHIIQPLVLKAFFDKKDGVLHPIATPKEEA